MLEAPSGVSTHEKGIINKPSSSGLSKMYSGISAINKSKIALLFSLINATIINYIIT
jgi:hypothetical protein